MHNKKLFNENCALKAELLDTKAAAGAFFNDCKLLEEKLVSCEKSLRESTWENDKLKAEIEAARKQEPVLEVRDFGCSDRLESMGGALLVDLQKFPVGTKLYAKPVPTPMKLEPCGYFNLLSFTDNTIYQGKAGDENFAALYLGPVPEHQVEITREIPEAKLVGRWNTDFRYPCIELLEGTYRSAFVDGTPIYASSVPHNI